MDRARNADRPTDLVLAPAAPRRAWWRRLLACRRGSSFQVLVIFLALSLGGLFLAGRWLLDIAGVVHAGEPAAKPADEPLPAVEPERLASPGAAPAELESARRIRDVLAAWTLFSSEGLCVAGEARVEGAGRVGSNGGVLLLGAAAVDGVVHPGPGARVQQRGAAQLARGSAALRDRVELPSIVAPELRASGRLAVEAANRRELDAGDHAFAEVELGDGATLSVRGPARVVVRSLRLGRGARFEVDDAGGPVELFVMHELLASSGAELTPLGGDPTGLTVLLAADNLREVGAAIDLSSGLEAEGALVVGRVYAPRAMVRLDAASEVRGALVARVVHVDGRARVVGGSH